MTLQDFYESKFFESLGKEQFYRNNFNIAIGILGALSLLQNGKVTHKDLKLDNIMYDPKSGKCTLMDLGISHCPDSKAHGETSKLLVKYGSDYEQYLESDCNARRDILLPVVKERHDEFVATARRCTEDYLGIGLTDFEYEINKVLHDSGELPLNVTWRARPNLSEREKDEVRAAVRMLSNYKRFKNGLGAPGTVHPAPMCTRLVCSWWRFSLERMVLINGKKSFRPIPTNGATR
jgi:serine/threonine protein kinase